MKIVVSAATEIELAPVKAQVASLYSAGNYALDISFQKSGVGMLSTMFSLTKLAVEFRPDLIIQAGIAGSFDHSMALGEVVAVRDELPGDIGVEENGAFLDIFDMKLEDGNEFPFKEKRLSNLFLNEYNYTKLPEVSGVTVNEVTTRIDRIILFRDRYKASIESMEGAALHYAGLQLGIPFIQIRSISNYVGERDKSKWQLKPALQNLTATLLEYLDFLYHFTKAPKD